MSQMQPVVGTEQAGDTNALLLTQHCMTRCAQRGVSERAIDLACTYGRLIYSTGAQFLFMGRQEVETACACGVERQDVERCRGLVVLLARDGSVITVYKNDRALEDIRRKKPYDKRRRTLAH